MTEQVPRGLRATDLEERRRLFERPDGRPYDETDISLRAYVARIPPEKLREYDPGWTDDRVIEWDGNFREDGELMLVCCERDVGVEEFRNVVEEFRKVVEEFGASQDLPPLTDEMVRATLEATRR